MRKRYFLISKHYIWVLFFLFGLWPAEYFKHLAHGETLVKLFSIGVSILVLVSYSKKYSKYCVAVIAFEIWMVLNTVIHGYNPMNILVDGVKNVTICVLTERELESNEERYLKVLCSFLSSYLIINFVTICAFPGGLWTTEYTTEGRYYFLGYENNIVLTLFPMIVFTVYRLLNKYEIKLLHILGIVCGIAAEIVRECTTGLVMISLFAIICMVINFKVIRRLFNKWTIVFTVVGTFVGIVFWGIQEKFATFFMTVLNRDVTFTFRTYIWDIFSRMVIKNPIIGYGCEPREVILSKVNAESVFNLNYAIHAHDLYLDIFYKGGIIGLVLWIIVVIIVLKQAKDNVNVKTGKVMLAALFIYFIAFIIESYPYMLQLFYVLTTVIYVGKKQLIARNDNLR